jgi:hypothetical protein
MLSKLYVQSRLEQIESMQHFALCLHHEDGFFFFLLVHHGLKLLEFNIFFFACFMNCDFFSLFF